MPVTVTEVVPVTVTEVVPVTVLAPALVPVPPLALVLVPLPAPLHIVCVPLRMLHRTGHSEPVCKIGDGCGGVT